MIVPASRLLFWVAVVVLPFALLGAVSPPAAGAVPVVRSADCSRWRWPMPSAHGQSLAGIGVELPAVARMSKDREAKLEVRIRNERQRPKTLAPGAGPAARNPDRRSEDHGRRLARAKRMVAADLALHAAPARQLPA